MKKVLYTLNIGNYCPEITKLTYPLIERYAKKIGADFHIIQDRKWKAYPVVYEKLQIHRLGASNDWNIYIDSDAVVHPDLFDVTEHLHKDTIMHHAVDLAGCRWKYDNYFRRDGRHIGAANWFTVASDWCLDLWEPLQHQSFKEAVDSIQTSARESRHAAEHLIDDYVLSRNIARYGLKVTTFLDTLKKLGRPEENYFWHSHLFSEEQKLEQITAVMKHWGIFPTTCQK